MHALTSVTSADLSVLFLRARPFILALYVRRPGQGIEAVDSAYACT